VPKAKSHSLVYIFSIIV